MGARLACVIVVASAIGCGSPSRAPSDASEAPTADAPPLSGEFGAACTKHTDCASGFCVEPVGNSGGVCTRTCTDDCPTDWECRNVDLPQVDLELCIPASPQLCLACANDTECGGAACLEIDGAGRCATPCTDECPTGYTCAADPIGTRTGLFCQPVTGSCTCSEAMAGAERSCSEMNTLGSCLGTQKCDAVTGWSACTASTPAAETCDGSDNNCNFLIDDGLSSGEACTNTVGGIGSCPGIRSCEGAAGFKCVGQTPAMETCNFADDDCDLAVDEGFPGLNTSCTTGVGACLRYGSQRCNASGTGLTCSAVAGAPSVELCNQIDDNCVGGVDEPFKMGATALGTTCAAGLGVCARYGTFICRTDGTATQCSATAGTNATTETCNYLDDNCDGTVDNGYRNATTGFYDTDQNCGACGNDCTTQFNAQDSFGDCAVGTSAQCVMRCDAGHGNLNGSTFDGCEFTLDATSIYVSTTDATAIDDGTCGLGPTGTGTGNHPCKTITYGLTRAVMSSRPNVLVADGTYDEGVVLLNGKNVLGGYRADTWERHLTTTNTVIAGATSSGNHDRTVAAIDITAATVFEGFVVRGSFNTKPSGNSYAIYISGSNASLVVRNNEIFAGRGGAGLAGAPGTNGLQGVNGGGSSGPNDNTYNAIIPNNCSGNSLLFSVRAYANGGARSCNGDVVNGGNGGGNRCPPSWGSNISPPQATEKSALDGASGSSADGAGGGTAGAGTDAGDDGFIHTNGFRCVIPGAPTFAPDAAAGSPGSSASGVAGCSIAGGMVTGGQWVAGSGSAGLPGSNGGGGGGGGAGGGAYCYDCNPNPQLGGNHRIGGHGGGGGSGGCGGTGGGAGQPGGGVFGIFITGGTAPTIATNTISGGVAGSGGAGGIGGAGGLGGQGGAGGQSEQFCADKAGRGGDGGSAGHGSGGGGGCGGSSFGIFTSGIGSPAYCGTNSVSGGSAGAGGSGGFSGGNSGGAGTAGVLQTCVSL